MMGTKPVAEHAWLQHFVGNWNVVSVMTMGPDTEPVTGHGTEKVVSLGGLWAFAEGEAKMPNGEPMCYKSAIGYDVSFKEYRGCWFADQSSHLWKQVGMLSPDGKTLTLDCVGPHMEKDGETANYRDVHHIIDENHRTMTSFGQSDDGTWVEFMKTTFTRA